MLKIVSGLLNNVFKTKDIRVLVKNFMSLSVLQAVNSLLPLITMPYLLRVLAPESFGVIAIAQAIMQYLTNLTDYGFNLTATKELSINKQNKEKVSEIFNSVMVIKFVLMLLSFLILCVLVASIEDYRSEALVYFLSFGMVLGNVLFQTWFFQGMEKMFYITVINIISKLFFTVLVFFLIKDKGDYLYYPLLLSLGFVISGIISLFIVYRDFKIVFRFPSFSSLKYYAKEGWYVFISTFMLSLYTNSTVIILGIVTSEIYAGYYSAAEKIISAIYRLFLPIQQAVYPYVSRLVNDSKRQSVNFIRKLTAFVGGISFVISLGIFLFSSIIVDRFCGPQYQSSVIVFRILSFIIFVKALGNVFGIQTMLAYDFKKAYMNIIVSAFVLHVTLSLLLGLALNHIGVSISVMIAETYIVISSLIFLQYKGIKIISFSKEKVSG